MAVDTSTAAKSSMQEDVTAQSSDADSGLKPQHRCSSHDEAMGDETKASPDDGAGGDDSDAGDGSWCPLFMTGLPRDFASNPGLAAIASLLGDDEADDEAPRSSAVGEKLRKQNEEGGASGTVWGGERPRSGGGKCGGASRKKKGSSASSRSRSRPYPAAASESKDKASERAAVGEAQLFLNMWKI